MGQVNLIRQGGEEWSLHHDMTGEACLSAC